MIHIPVLRFLSGRCKALPLVVLLLAFANAGFATDCATLCRNAGYSNSHCDGTAPFCDGECDDLSEYQNLFADPDGYIDCAGKCTDGSSCWSGSKQCSCYDPIDCDEACAGASAPSYNGMWGEQGVCAVNFVFSNQNCPECVVRILGACNWSDADETVLLCYCVYEPEDLVD